MTSNSPQGPKSAPPGKHFHLWPWLLGGLIVVIAVIAFLTHRHSAAAAAPRGRGGASGPTMVSTATAQKGNIGVYVNALGIVTPVYTVSVEARVAGQIVKVSYQEGQRVHIGDPLVDIDPRPYQAAVNQAQGQLEHDNAQLEDAKIDLSRYKEAMASNAIPEQQYETQLATVHEDEGTVQLDQGNLTNAEVNLDYCHITSPIDGRVGLRLVDPGNIVQANGTTPLVVIAQLQPITVEFNVAEDDIPKILPQFHKDKQLPMDVYDREDQAKITTGTLDAIDNEINTGTGTLKLRGVCSNEDESLVPNQFVNVHLLVNTLSDITVLPNSVIQRNSDTAYVYLVKTPENGQTNQAVEMHPVNVGATDGNVSQVDLDPGTTVAADNFNRLTDGAPVTLRPAGGQGQGQGQKHGHKQDSQ
ncbi:MAG TPA: efflux RND transporter periplasmic adaptor subunit [Candidatus Acidoferrales bacterium]|nr:efflux RND transporter periplasmic adaptor subunit [Candidatus Acidoferrales bacterium]